VEASASQEAETLSSEERWKIFFMAPIELLKRYHVGYWRNMKEPHEGDLFENK
jgi:hypothetical protein